MYRPGGGAASAAASVAVEGVEAVARTEAGGKKKGHQKRRRGGEVGAGSDSESDEEGGRGGGRGKRRTAAVRDDGERVSSCRDVQACLRLLKACLACVPLASHQVGCCCYGRLLLSFLYVALLIVCFGRRYSRFISIDPPL